MNRTMICGTVFLLALAAGSAHAQAVKGTGTGGTLPVWTSTSTIGNSVLTQSGGNVSNASGYVAGKQLVSTVTTGTAPLIVSSSTVVTNLNANFLGGLLPAGFIQNTSSPQTGAASFNISGNGTLGGLLSAGTVNSAGAYQIGGSNVLSIPSGNNTFVGFAAGMSNTVTGTFNAAVGVNALTSNTTGFDNTAIGAGALGANIDGFDNTAIGFKALFGDNINGSHGTENTASGYQALSSTTTGSTNIADGFEALTANTSGSSNTASGGFALSSNTMGSANTALGANAGQSLTTGSANILVGFSAGGNFTSTESDNVDIGNQGTAGDGGSGANSGIIRIGTDSSQPGSCFVGCQVATYIAAINGVAVSGSTVLISSSGQLGTAPSSRRYKEDIHDMGAASDGLLRLRPVTFRYKKAFDDGSKPLQYGLVAEEVAEVYPELVVRGKDGQVETVQYYKLDAMLLNEIQKLAKAHAADQAEIAQLRSQVADQLKQGQEQQAAIRQLLDRVRVIQAALAATSGAKATPAEVAARY